MDPPANGEVSSSAAEGGGTPVASEARKEEGVERLDGSGVNGQGLDHKEGTRDASEEGGETTPDGSLKSAGAED